MNRVENAVRERAVRGLESRTPELEIPRLARGAGYGGKKRKRGLVEGFRVLTLLYRVGELPAGAFQRLVELFRMYRAVGALYFWSKRLNLEGGVELALERAKLQLPSYYRHAFDEESQVYQFGEVEKMKRPRKVVLQLPLADALHYHCGAYIEDKANREAGWQREAGAASSGESAGVASGEGAGGCPFEGREDRAYPVARG